MPKEGHKSHPSCDSQVNSSHSKFDHLVQIRSRVVRVGKCPEFRALKQAVSNYKSAENLQLRQVKMAPKRTPVKKLFADKESENVQENSPATNQAAAPISKMHQDFMRFLESFSKQ